MATRIVTNYIVFTMRCSLRVVHSLFKIQCPWRLASISVQLVRLACDSEPRRKRTLRFSPRASIKSTDNVLWVVSSFRDFANQESPKAAKSALIFGATGQTGRHLLRELVASPTFTRVCEAGRRVTPAEDLPAQASGKLEQKVIDFERLDEAGLKEGQWDVVFIACV